MTSAFARLASLLQEQGTLTDAVIHMVESDLGAMTAIERLWLSLERHELMQRAGAAITLDAFLAATQQLESAPPGSPEYERARQLVEDFESAA